MADIAEGTGCLPFLVQRFNGIILPSLTHDEARIRQAAWFAMGQLTDNPSYHGDHWNASIQPLVAPLLNEALDSPQDDEAEANATSNIISACFKQFVKTQPTAEWLSWLEKYYSLCLDAEEACSIGHRVLAIAALPTTSDADKIKAKTLVAQIADNTKARGINIEDNEAALNTLIAAL
jgi:hypothetical protein